MGVVSMANSFRATRDLTRSRYQISQKFMSAEEAVNRSQVAQEKFTNDSGVKSNQINDVHVLTTGTNINHKLGKKYSGFNVVKNSSNANIYVDTANTEAEANKDSFIRLKSSSNTTISITVF